MKKQLCLLLIVGLLLSGCAAEGGSVEPAVSQAPQEDTMYQVSTLQALMLGDYYGSATVAELKAHGDLGLGTFDTLDGEMIMLDGEVYQAKGDGSIVKCADDLTVPFASVTPFTPDRECALESVADLATLKEILTAAVATDNKNLMYAVKITGIFDSVTCRSARAQTEPYKDLNTVMLTDQVIFEPLTAVEGSLVGLYFPDYMDGINTPGWHFHFITADLSAGGHVLQLALSGMTAQLDQTDAFYLQLPEDAVFPHLELTTDLQQAIAIVEGN